MCTVGGSVTCSMGASVFFLNMPDGDGAYVGISVGASVGLYVNGRDDGVGLKVQPLDGANVQSITGVFVLIPNMSAGVGTGVGFGVEGNVDGVGFNVTSLDGARVKYSTGLLVLTKSKSNLS